jgi:hypothetical protein
MATGKDERAPDQGKLDPLESLVALFLLALQSTRIIRLPSTSRFGVDRFKASRGQRQFLLSRAPANPEHVTFIVRGVIQEYGVDYTVSGNEVTWTDKSFSMDEGDSIRVDYFS